VDISRDAIEAATALRLCNRPLRLFEYTP